MPDAQGRPSGFASEVLLAVAARLGWALDVQYMPWLQAADAARQGRCDLLYTVLRRSDYEEFLVFPEEPVQRRANVLIAKRERRLRFDGDLEAFMRRHSIGVYRDKAVDEHFELLRRAPWARVEVAGDAHTNILKLLNGRFDAAIENEMTAVYELRLAGRLDEVEFLAPPLNEIDAYIAFAKAGRLASRSSEFSRNLAAFRQTGEFTRILSRYGSSGP
jgi:polar amino acid transport system substrate-binding protein